MGSSGPAGQTKALAPQGRANSELRDSPTRPKGGAAPKKENLKTLIFLIYPV